MPVLDENSYEPFDSPEFELVALRAQQTGSRIVARRQLAALVSAGLLVGIFVLSSLAVALGIP